jgi:predicted flavoprotein YhiN
MPTLLALGGSSWPELGSDGHWVSLFREAGIDVVPFAASNVRQPMSWTQIFRERFKGLPIKNVAVSLAGARARGELMIAEDGLEGGALYALSRQLREGPEAAIEIDLKPDMSVQQVEAKIAQRKPKDSQSNFLRKAFNLSPQAIGLMREAKSANPKSVTLFRSGVPGVRRAISTAGGVAKHEVTPGFQLKKKPHVWVAGEMLNWDAPTGGYLLQASLATARMAALDMVDVLT